MASQVVLGVLQNMWTSGNPKRQQPWLDRISGDHFDRLCRAAIFGGCISGKRIRSTFGPTLRRVTHWTNASRTIVGHAGGLARHDPRHLSEVLLRVKPEIVLCFGKVADAGISEVFSGRMIIGPHPASRQAGTTEALQGMAAYLEKFAK